jgi:hypothetical protein
MRFIAFLLPDRQNDCHSIRIGLAGCGMVVKRFGSIRFVNRLIHSSAGFA